jgi:hypothetical protein
MINDENLKLKVSWRCPFKCMYLAWNVQNVGKIHLLENFMMLDRFL